MDLVGMKFITFHDSGKLKYCGDIRARLSDDYFLVCIWEALLLGGADSYLKVASLAEMVDWELFDTDEWFEGAVRFRQKAT